MGFRLQQKSMTLNDLERQFTAVSSVLCVLRLRLESSAFCYKLSVYLIYLHIKFDDEIEKGLIRISCIIFD